MIPGTHATRDQEQREVTGKLVDVATALAMEANYIATRAATYLAGVGEPTWDAKKLMRFAEEIAELTGRLTRSPG